MSTTVNSPDIFTTGADIEFHRSPSPIQADLLGTPKSMSSSFVDLAEDTMIETEWGDGEEGKVSGKNKPINSLNEKPTAITRRNTTGPNQKYPNLEQALFSTTNLKSKRPSLSASPSSMSTVDLFGNPSPLLASFVPPVEKRQSVDVGVGDPIPIRRISSAPKSTEGGGEVNEGGLFSDEHDARNDFDIWNMKDQERELSEPVKEISPFKAISRPPRPLPTPPNLSRQSTTSTPPSRDQLPRFPSPFKKTEVAPFSEDEEGEGFESAKEDVGDDKPDELDSISERGDFGGGESGRSMGDKLRDLRNQAEQRRERERDRDREREGDIWRQGSIRREKGKGKAREPSPSSPYSQKLKSTGSLRGNGPWFTDRFKSLRNGYSRWREEEEDEKERWDGVRIIGSREGSQYTGGGVSSCGLAALSATRLILLSAFTLSDLNEFTISQILEICPHYNSDEHLSVEDIHLQVPVFNSSLVKETGEYMLVNKKNLDRMVRAHLDRENGRGRAVILTKTPEIVVAFRLLDGELILFDSHPRPLHPDGAAFLHFEEDEELVRYLEKGLFKTVKTDLDLGVFAEELMGTLEVWRFKAHEVGMDWFMELGKKERGFIWESQIGGLIKQKRMEALEGEVEAMKVRIERMKEEEDRRRERNQREMDSLTANNLSLQMHLEDIQHSRQPHQRTSELLAKKNELLTSLLRTSNALQNALSGMERQVKLSEEVEVCREDVRNVWKKAVKDGVVDRETITAVANGEGREEERKNRSRRQGKGGAGSGGTILDGMASRSSGVGSSHQRQPPSPPPRASVWNLAPSPPTTTTTNNRETPQKKLTYTNASVMDAISFAFSNNDKGKSKQLSPEEEVARYQAMVEQLEEEAEREEIERAIRESLGYVDSEGEGERKEDEWLEKMRMEEEERMEKEKKEEEWLEKMRKEEEEKGRAFECGICLDDKAGDDIALETECFHQFCRECLYRHIISTIQDKPPRFPVMCPAERCELILSRHQAELLLRTEEEYQAWMELEMTTLAMPLTCPKCRKQEWVDREEFLNGRVLDCPFRCGYSWCRRCDEACTGQDHECGENALKELMKEKGWKACPSCETPVEKIMGCNHMTCGVPACNTHFCYLDHGTIQGALICKDSNRDVISAAVSQHYGTGQCANKMFVEEDLLSNPVQDQNQQNVGGVGRNRIRALFG